MSMSMSQYLRDNMPITVWLCKETNMNSSLEDMLLGCPWKIGNKCTFLGMHPGTCDAREAVIKWVKGL